MRSYRHLLRNHGFSLMELAVVLMIVTLLIGGMLMPLSAQHEIRGRQETDKALATIREALLGFAIVNGRLPCPAVASIPTGTTVSGLAAGYEAVTATGGPCACTASASGIAGTGTTACHETTPGYVTGVLPWATLGLPETDAWGNRYTYTMIALFGRANSGQTTFGTDASNNACTATTPTAAAFALCTARTSSNGIDIQVTSGGNKIASAVPAVVISHGKNMLGAYLPAGTQISGASGDEAVNAGGTAAFVSSTGIDDMLTWIPASTLMSKMIAAGKLP